MPIEIPNYRIVEKLGDGAESCIYRARCMRTGKDYAVKIVKVSKPEDTSYVDLLRAEHVIGSSINHPVIRKVYELRIMRQRLRLRGAILFMEYVAGIPMSSTAFHRSLNELLGMFRQAAYGLHEMHISGWVHADLKPNNIMVTSDDSIKLIDLGQSSKIHEAKPRIQGTIDYMAPEQAQRGVLDQRTDVFGLGAALHRVVTGKPVLTEMNQTVNIHSQSLIGKRISQIREPSSVELPACVARLIDDCCQSDPSGRISDMPSLIERINLAQTILEKQSARELSLESETESATREATALDDTLSDTIAHDLGLKVDDASVDLIVEDDSVDLEDLHPKV
ncbi:MAG: serine/threonine protein kinase [Phycisphaerales bacterium]|nr:MAG: serine/threonine protein kinase [Phycisphaerales bacterium]